MEITALGYIGISSSQIDQWSRMATGLLGMQQVDRGAKMRAFRMDDRKQRLIVDGGSDAGLAVMGWEVPSTAELDQLAGRLESHGIKVIRGSRALADERHVAELIAFADPAGNRLEAFCKPELASEPFRPGRPISGFRTGALGMGHAVLTVASAEKALPFYRDVLGLRLSDYMLKPFGAYFFHANPRHHSLALIETGQDGLHHIMVETCSLDDVGQGYDIALAEGGRIGTSLGRHSNDFVTSFYARTPSPFLLEYGWGGRTLDTKSWQAVELDCGPSLWGHEREWLPEDKRAVARDMRMKAAADARRAPVYVLPGQYVVPD